MEIELFAFGCGWFQAPKPFFGRNDGVLMKGVVFNGHRQVELEDFPDPTPGPGDVVIAVRASGMRGSDLYQYRSDATRPATISN